MCKPVSEKINIDIGDDFDYSSGRKKKVSVVCINSLYDEFIINTIYHGSKSMVSDYWLYNNDIRLKYIPYELFIRHFSTIEEYRNNKINQLI